MWRMFPVRRRLSCFGIRNTGTSALDAASFYRHRWPQEFELDLGRCLLCGLCAEACPEDVSVMDGKRLSVGRSRQDLILDTEDLQLPAVAG